VISQFKFNAWIGCILKGAQAAALHRLCDAQTDLHLHCKHEAQAHIMQNSVHT